MHYGKRLAQIRNRTSLTQSEVAEWEGISKQAIANREAKANPVVGLQHVARLLEETSTDARFLFGQIDDIGLADVRWSSAPSAMADMLSEWKQLKHQDEARLRDDSLGSRVDADERLARIVRRLLRHRGQFDRIEGYLDRLDEDIERAGGARKHA